MKIFSNSNISSSNSNNSCKMVIWKQGAWTAGNKRKIFLLFFSILTCQHLSPRSYTPLSRQQLPQHPTQSGGAVPSSSSQRSFTDGGGYSALRDDQSDTASERSVTPNSQSAASTPNLPYPAVHPLLSHLRHWYEHAPGPGGQQHHTGGPGNNQ